MDLTALLDATVRASIPLALAALGELLIERSGIINIGLEGCVLGGAFAAALVAHLLGAQSGLLGGACAGIAIGALFALFAVSLRADQIITGTAITLLALGMTATLARGAFGAEGVALTLPLLPSVPVPLLSRIPVLGPAFFTQPAIAYATVIAGFALSWSLSHTKAGLALRAVGESPSAASAAGIHPGRVQWFAILGGCMLAGVSGAVLVLAQSGTFVEGMSAGRGFIAIAIVALGRWRPLRVLAAAFLFGAATALQFTAQAFGWRLPYQFFLATPYIVTLAILAISVRRQAAPAALGRTSSLI